VAAFWEPLDPVKRLAISPDGKSLAVAGDVAVEMWKVPLGKQD
jgi:hypothetical protein